MKNITKNLLWLLLWLPLSAFTQTTLTGDWTFEAPTEDGKMIPVKLSISADSYTVDFGMDGNSEVKGRYMTEGNQITIWDVEGANACPADAKGVYTFEVTETTMTMTKIKDDCDGRGGPEGKMMFQRAK